MSAKSQLSLLLCYMALLLSVAAAMPVRQQPIQQQRAYPSAPAATVPVHAQAAAEWQNDASTQQAMQDNAQILTQMQQRLQQQQAQAVQSAYQQYAQRTSTPTSLQTAAAAPADPMMEPQYIEPQMRGYSSGYASSVGSPCSRYDASGACDPSASVEMRAATGAPTSQIPSSIRARTAAVGEPADSEDALERPYSDRFGGDNSESKPYADDRKQSPPKPAAAEPPVEKDWRTACAQRCEERNMDVTGVGVQAISTDKAEVRATIEHRKMVNTTLTEGTLQPMELAQLINEVQTQVSTKAAAVVEFLQTDPKISPSISKLRTSGLTLEPLYEYVSNRMFLSGYRATNSITFRVDIPLAGVVVDEIVNRGVTRIEGITFVASPKELNAARHIAIQSAVEDAIEQALSSISGLGKFMPVRSDLQIIKMDIVGVTRPEAINMENGRSGWARAEAVAAPMMAKSFMQESSPIEGEEKTVSATVAMKIRF